VIQKTSTYSWSSQEKNRNLFKYQRVYKIFIELSATLRCILYTYTGIYGALTCIRNPLTCDIYVMFAGGNRKTIYDFQIIEKDLSDVRAVIT